MKVHSLVLCAAFSLSLTACSGSSFFGISPSTSTKKSKAQGVNETSKTGKSWEERLQMTQEEILEEHLSFISDTYGDDSFEVYGFHFEGFETLLTTFIDSLDPDIASETLEETFERLNLDPYENHSVTEDEKIALMEQNEEIVGGRLFGQSGSESEEDLALIQQPQVSSDGIPKPGSACDYQRNADGWSPKVEKNGQCQDKAASFLDNKVQAEGLAAACKAASTISVENRVAKKVMDESGRDYKKTTGGLEDDLYIKGQSESAIYGASAVAAENWEGKNNCNP